MNLCRACGEDFAGISYFDKHRVGVHAYTFAEGMRHDPPVEDGRRCLAASELREKGWEKNAKGRWFDPAEAARIREAHE